MPLRPFAPSDNASARPDAVAALAALLLKGDTKPSADVDAFLDADSGLDFGNRFTAAKLVADIEELVGTRNYAVLLRAV